MVNDGIDITRELQSRYGDHDVTPQTTCDGMTTLWVPKEKVHEVLR